MLEKRCKAYLRSSWSSKVKHSLFYARRARKHTGSRGGAPAGGAGGRSPPDKQINRVKGRSPLWVVKGEALKKQPLYFKPNTTTTGGLSTPRRQTGFLVLGQVRGKILTLFP